LRGLKTMYNLLSDLDVIKASIEDFEAITLSEMDGVKLMDRTDVKYLIPVGLLAYILKDLKPDYRVLEVNNQRLCPYETLYFDTPDLELYHAHQRGQLNRYKVRFRNYIGSDLSFFEVKFKNNKGRTIKKRIKRSEQPNTFLDEKNGSFLEQKSDLDPTQLQAVMWVDYLRITLVNRTTAERVTIDLNLTFRNDANTKSYPKLAIAEVKQEKMSSSVFIDVMKKYKLRKGSISKYCFGIISLFEGIKQNNFKRHLKRVTKLNLIGLSNSTV
jgi:VTC domain